MITGFHGRPGLGPFSALTLLLPLLSLGCGKPPPSKKMVAANPQVHLYQLHQRDIVAEIGQPAFVYAYEQTSIFPKVSGYVDHWYVDIGQHLRKGQEMAHIYVPELVAELGEAKAQAALDKVQIEVNQRLVEVAAGNKEVAEAQQQSAQANVAKAQAGVERWTSEVERMSKIANLLDQQQLQEAQKELKVQLASREASKADVAAARAATTARQADVEKARTDVEAARAKATVSQEHVKRLEALVSYTHILAPYDCVVVDRNANTYDYVEPARGDLSAGRNSSNQSAGQFAPLYVVASTDKVRVFVDVSESQSAFVVPGTPASIVFEAQRGEEVKAAVARTSWALQFRTRTLRAEIDLPTPQAQLSPGMYAYAHLTVERKNVWAVPITAVTEIGEQKCIYLYEGGKAFKTPVEAGLDDGKYVELYHKQVKGRWVEFDGSEQVILGELGELGNGREVEVEK